MSAVSVDLENLRIEPDNPHATGAHEGQDVRIEPCPRRLRVRFAGEVIADSTRAVYLFERSHLPVYYFPRSDVRMDLLRPTDHTTHCPRKGDAAYWSVVVGDRTSENAAWGYPEVIDSCPDISDHVAFYWNRVDEWYEEDDQVFVHARDPYKRVDAMHSSRHVQVKVGGVVIAESNRPCLVFETGLPVRYYLPKLDVRMDLLTPTATRTACPYKGEARYWSAQVNGAYIEDIAWSYPSPIPEIPKIENLVCFWDERVDEVVVDGVVQERPVTMWSR